jgi:hypothetical protein
MAKQATNQTNTVVDTTPKPTGKLGGQGEFYHFPSLGVYAPLVNGDAAQPQFDEQTWQVISAALPSVDIAKASVITALKKAEVKQVIGHSVTFKLNAITASLEASEDLSGSYTVGDFVELLDRLENDQDVNDALLAVKSAYVMVEVKSRKRSNSTGTIVRHGNGSSTFIAASQDQLKTLAEGSNPKLDLWLSLASVNGFNPDDWEDYNLELPPNAHFTSRKNAAHIDIVAKKRGIATQTLGGVQFVDYSKMYDGFDIDHLYV